MLENDLLSLGLSEKEARVYLAVLELGKASANEISKKAGVNRATAYFILKSLMKLGLVSELEEKRAIKFAGESPERIKVLLKRKEEEIKDSENLLEKILPQLRSIYNRLENKPIVRYFDGQEGPRLLREDILKGIKNDEIFSFTNLDLIEGIFSDEENKEFREKKLKNKIKTCAIYTSKKEIKINQKGIEAHLIDDKAFKIDSDISIYGDTIQIAKVFGKDNFGVITIKDKDIADTVKSLFKLALECVKK